MVALFVGLTTLDIAHLVPRYPVENSKTQAAQQFVGAGGPAANAAAAYAHLAGESPTLLTGIGSGVFADLARADLTACRAAVVDAGSGELPVSSIVVAAATHTRTVVSLDAARMRVDYRDEFADLVSDTDIVLVDAHYGAVSIGVAQSARSRGIPVVLDAGRWKDVHSELLPLVDIAICSEGFVSGGVHAVHRLGPRYVAITAGSGPIVWSAPDGAGEIAVPRVDAVDTLGAGDVLHGAFCHFHSAGSAFVDALTQAAAVASESCRYFGTREWTTR